MSLQIPYKQALALLTAHHVPLAKQVLVEKADDLSKVFSKLSFPLAMKAISTDIVHKSDAGLVKVNITDEATARKYYDEFMKIIRQKFPKAVVEGILFQEMVKGTELIIGLNKDATFGHVIMFGLGGIFVEVLKDVTFRVTPVNKAEALSMIREIKGFKILEGIRGQEAADIERIAEIIASLSKIVEEYPDIDEIDLNPIFVNGKTISVADLRFLTADGQLRSA